VLDLGELDPRGTVVLDEEPFWSDQPHVAYAAGETALAVHHVTRSASGVTTFSPGRSRPNPHRVELEPDDLDCSSLNAIRGFRVAGRRRRCIVGSCQRIETRS
jgi:hypothetical protein